MIDTRSFNGKKSKWKDCICLNDNVHTLECRRNHERNRQRKYADKNREKRHRLREDHRCIICGRKVIPKIVYNQFCQFHKPRPREVKETGTIEIKNQIPLMQKEMIR